jgi:hypothetical protein
VIRRFAFALALVGCGETAPPDDGTCTGECRVTALTADFGTTRVLDRAVFGVTEEGNVQVEAYLGGAGGCPTRNGPTPDYALVLGNLAMLETTAPTAEFGNMLDFAGDLLGGDVSTPAELVVIHTDEMDLESFVALDIHLEFAGGTLDGHLYASYCSSFYEPLP